MVLEKTFESPLDCKEIKPVTRKRNKPSEYSLEGLMLKLKLQYFGHVMWRAGSSEKISMLGKIEGRRRRGRQRTRWLDGFTDSMGMNLGKLREMVKDREAWNAIVHVAESDMTGWLNNKHQFRIDKFIETEHRLVVARGWEREEWREKLLNE